MINIIVKVGETSDPFGAPVHAVDRLLGLDSVTSRAIVEDLRERGLIAVRMRASNIAESGEVRLAPMWWERVARARKAGE